MVLQECETNQQRSSRISHATQITVIVRKILSRTVVHFAFAITSIAVALAQKVAPRPCDLYATATPCVAAFSTTRDYSAKYLIFDRATNFSEEAVGSVKSLGIEPKRTSFRSPWQNGVAERWVGSCRRDLLDHVIVLERGILIN